MIDVDNIFKEDMELDMYLQTIMEDDKTDCCIDHLIKLSALTESENTGDEFFNEPILVGGALTC